ncbi:MAG TPA: FtsW/RodA/SpoVE family cell cycle protein [Melioribacteraceae bacterium]|nr:FtsW/RodA/SpoVE family cell cycle protein [Melioribacteraceae bacterium]
MNMKVISRVFLIVVIALVVMGIVMVLGATSGISKNYSMIRSHLGKVLLASGFFVATVLTPYTKYKKASKIMLFVGILMLIYTLIAGINIKGASRWINLGFISFQPSEFVKIVIVIHLANLIDRKGELLTDFKRGYLPVLFWIFLTVFFIILQPNLSTSFLIITVGFSLLYISGASLKHLGFTLLIVFVLGSAIMMSYSHGRARIYQFMGLTEKTEINIQSYQANIALGSGGLSGRGLANNRQSDMFLPEAYGDFIYAIIGEQFGFIGTVFVLLVYLFLMTLGVFIAYKCKDRYGQLLGIGLTLVISLNAFVNMAVVSGAAPVTGITLPFISFGGTSIMAFSSAAGIIANIALTYSREKSGKEAAEVANEITA